MSTQVHMRHGNGEYNNSYAHVDAFVDNRDVVIHSKGSCDPHMKKDGEKMINDYNLDINKPKINGHTLMGDMTNESLGLKGNVNAYGEKHKVKDYLYEIYYNNLDYDYALDYFDKVKVEAPMGACSAVRKGDFYGRNFDWIYDESASFIIRVPRIGNRYASMGVSGTESKLTNVVVDSNDYNEAYKILPFKIVDGINEYGVVANSNVVPNDKGINVETIPVIEKRDRVCNLMLVRYILDNFKTAQAAVSYIRDYVAVYPVKALEDMHYELHIMVADANNTYVLEVVNNEVIVKDVTNKPYMTNFYLDGVTFNDDGKTYYPAINDAEHNAKITNGVTDNGSGLERYAKIVDAYNTLNDFNSMLNFMSQELKYTKAYTGGDPEGMGEWYTEFVGNGITVASNPEDFTNVLTKSKNAFEHRSRNPQSKYYGTWQTTHTSVYDMRNKKVNVIVQEDGELLEYTFNALINTGGGSGTTDYTDLVNKPSINNIELTGNKTTADLGIIIPTKTSDLINDSNFVDDTYHDSTKQNTLISGTNIKTINNQSVLGEGNITIQGGDGSVTTGRLIGEDSALEISDNEGHVALRVTTEGELETYNFNSKDNKIEVNPTEAAEELATKMKVGGTVYEFVGGSGGSDPDYAKWFKNTLAGKTFSIMGDSISTQPAYNAPEIKITSDDVGVELNAWITPGDIDGGTGNTVPGTGVLTSLGGIALTSADKNQKKTFIPITEDIGKLVGQPHNYQSKGVKVWWEYLISDLGMELYNAVTWTGSSISDHEAKNRGRAQHQISYCWHESQIRKIGKRIDGSMDRIAPDYVLIYRGTNDMSHTPYTVIEEDPFEKHASYRYPSADEAEDGTHVDFAKALALTIKNIRDMYPNTKIVLCTFNNFIRVSGASTFPCNNGINSIAEYNKCIRNIADYFGCDVINFDKDNITWENCYSSGAVTDSASAPTHPNGKGHKIMGMRAIKDLLATSSEFNSIL